MEYEDIPLSNVDLQTFVKKFEKKGANIIEDKNILPNTPINEIFNNRGHAIVFHKYDNSQIGHWYALLQDTNKNVFMIDSFGEKPDKYCKNLIPCLKNNGIKSLTVNDLKMQKDNAICGRYCVVLCALHKLEQKVPKIYEFLTQGKKNSGSYDKFILDLTT